MYDCGTRCRFRVCPPSMFVWGPIVSISRGSKQHKITVQYNAQVHCI